MARPHSPQQNQPISPQQKQTLVETYERTHNMALAMREANIRSPKTAYLWWNRYTEDKEAGLQPRSHARHTQKRLDDSVVEQILEMRRQQPESGRRQIANSLTLLHGQQVASPASVEAVLRQANLWKQAPQQQAAPTARVFEQPDWLRNGVDYDRLLVAIQSGIRLSIGSQARPALRVLYHEIWRPLEADPSLWNRLLAAPQIGSWLLCSRLHLGHCLMNSGYRLQAEQYLRQTIDWMREHPIEPRQRAWEDAPHFVSIRRDDVWLGCYQHLGLVLGKRDVEGGYGYLYTAWHGIQRLHRPVVPDHRSMLGDLERDLAHGKLRMRHLPEAEIRQHLRNAQESAEEWNSRSAQVFAHLAWTQLYDRLASEAGIREHGTRQRQRELIEQSLDRALQLVEGEQEDRPMRQTLCYVDAAQLAAAHGLSINGQQVQRAAEYCLIHGYGGQAEHLLAIPHIDAWLPEDTRAGLARLIT